MSRDLLGAKGRMRAPVRSLASGPVVLLVVFVGYVLGSELAFRLNDALDLQAALFVPAGLTVGALLRLRRSLWGWVLVAAATGELVQDLRSGLTVSESLGFVAANTIEPLVGALLLLAVLRAPVDLGYLRHVFAFLACAVLAGPAVGAVLGAATDRSLGGGELVRTFWQWWLGDALGVLLFGSLILVWASAPDRRSLRSASGAVLMVGSVIVSVAVFSASDLPLSFLVLTGVVVAGAQFGPRAVALTSVLIAITTAISLTLDHDVVLVGMPGSTAIVVIKLQFAVFTVAGLVVAAEVAERERATAAAAHSAAQVAAEHTLVERLQRLLLPQEHLVGAHFDAHGRYRAASLGIGVGGDWYDVVELRDGRVFVSVGDVVGRGAEAAAAMGKLRAVLSVLAAEAGDVTVLLHRLDAAAEGIPGGLCASAWVGFFDPFTGQLSYASAGHLPGFLVEGDGAVHGLPGPSSALVGVSPGAPKHVSTVAVSSTATLVLYTDGLVERRGEGIDQGIDRLSDALEAARRSGRFDCEGILEDLTVPERDDDTVLLMVALTRALRVDQVEGSAETSMS